MRYPEPDSGFKIHAFIHRSEHPSLPPRKWMGQFYLPRFSPRRPRRCDVGVSGKETGISDRDILDLDETKDVLNLRFANLLHLYYRTTHSPPLKIKFSVHPCSLLLIERERPSTRDGNALLGAGAPVVRINGIIPRLRS